MRLLKFIINGQQIQQDPNCDFTGIIAGTTNYLKASFTFSDDWQNTIKAASFYRGEKEQAVLVENGECIIPSEVLTGATFFVSVVGFNKDKDYRIRTNKVLVRQEVIK